MKNTGIQIGSATTLLDPQTGHYTTELPIAPEMLGDPKVLTGVDNALRGFNSTTGTISYTWSSPKAVALPLAGDHRLNFQRFIMRSGTYNKKDWMWGAEIESSVLKAMARYLLAITLLPPPGESSQTDFLLDIRTNSTDGLGCILQILAI